jgi:branched-chain amino acid transport system ATP-binding protein
MTTAAPSPLLELYGVSAAYGEVQALFDVNLEVRPGEVVALLGSNGAGKTTFLRVVSGLLPARQGTVRFLGEDITSRRPDLIVELGIAHVPEGRQLFSDMTVEENLQLGAYIARARRRRRANLERTFAIFPRLGERRHQLAGTLSGGEQQMLAIGRGLMSEPRLLLLDEPSLGLSPLLTEQTLSVVKAIAREDLTVLLVEQKVLEALEIADRGYVIESGRVVREGTSAALRTDPAIVQAYLGI